MNVAIKLMDIKDRTEFWFYCVWSEILRRNKEASGDRALKEKRKLKSENCENLKFQSNSNRFKKIITFLMKTATTANASELRFKE